MLKRVPLSWDVQRGYHVNVPTYFMIACTHLPIKPGMIHRDGVYPNADPADVMRLKPTVIVSMPEDECVGEDGQLCHTKMAEKYRGNMRFDSADYEPPPLLDFHPIELEPPKEYTLFQRLAHKLGMPNK